MDSSPWINSPKPIEIGSQKNIFKWFEFKYPVITYPVDTYTVY